MLEKGRGQRRSSQDEREVGTDTDDLASFEQQRQYTSTGTQCDLGGVRMAPRFASTGTQSTRAVAPVLADPSHGKQYKVGVKIETDVRGESIGFPTDIEEILLEPELAVPPNFELGRSKQDESNLTDAKPLQPFVVDIPKVRTYVVEGMEKKEDDETTQVLTATRPEEEKETKYLMQSNIVSFHEEETAQEELIETIAIMEEVESSPDNLILELEEVDRVETVPHTVISSERENMKTRHPIGDIMEGEETVYTSSVSVTSKKKLVKQNTFPVTAKEDRPAESSRVTVTSKEAEDVRRSTMTVLPAQKHSSSYAEKRRLSIEKLKASMDDINVLMGRRKSEARDLLLAKTGVDYHSFLIWMMFSEGELNNVKCISATYTILMEQKAYLQVQLCFVCIFSPDSYSFQSHEDSLINSPIEM